MWTVTAVLRVPSAVATLDIVAQIGDWLSISTGGHSLADRGRILLMFLRTHCALNFRHRMGVANGELIVLQLISDLVVL